MKKMTALFLSVLILLGCMGAIPNGIALKAGAEAAAVGLPAVGDTVEGFTAKEIREFPLIGATQVLFEHNDTGARLLYIANDDINRVFHLAFATRAHDDKGLPHVFEHATLSGSDKYPSKTLFFNLSYQTYNTYMNANTHNFMTTYPVASLSEEQLLRLADFYTDSCLHPSILKDESIYREEAWRYRMMSPEADLTVEGTVYSEMLGAMNLSGWAVLNSLRDAFPGSTASYQTGGLPDAIRTMTFEDLKSYHDLYYHPSNCCGVLYGSFRDYTAFLKLLNEAFAGYEKKDFSGILADRDYTPITGPVVNAHPFAAEAGSDTANKSMAVYTFVVPGTDAQDRLVLNTMTDIMASDASSFRQAVKTALPAAQTGCYVNTYTPDFSVVFYAMNINPEDAETFRDLVDNELAKAAAEGFPQDLIDNVSASLKVSSRLIRENPAVGVETVSPDTLYYWLSGGNPWEFQEYEDSLARVDEWNRQGLYAETIGRCLAGSRTTVLSTTYPEAGLKDTQDAALAENLAAVKAAMSSEEIDAIVAASNEGDEDAPDPAMIASLQAVDVRSLPEEIRLYEISDTMDEAGVRHIDTLAAVDGIGQVDLMLDAAGIPVEDIHDFKLLTDLIPYLGSDTHSREELAGLSGLYLYNRGIRMSLLEEPEGDGLHVFFRLSWVAQDEYLEKGYELIREIAFGLNLDDAQAVLDAVNALKTGLRTTISNAPYNTQIYRAAGREDLLYRLYSYANFLEYYTYLEQAGQALQEDPETFLAELKRVRSQLCNSTNAIALYAGSAKGAAANRPLADAFLAGLNHEEIIPVNYDSLPAAARREALIVDSAVQYNMIQAGEKELGTPYSADMDALSNLVLDAYLYPQLRDQYGAYSVMHGAGEHLGMYVLSYRDPNVTETFAVYDKIPEFLQGETEQETLDGYILSAYSQYASGSGELTGAVSAEISLLEGRDPAERLQRMRELKGLTSEKVKAYAETYRILTEKGTRSTAGGTAVIEANADLYDVILNPFNVKAPVAADYTDVPEGSEYYETVRYVTMNGYMRAVSETEFGVDKPAAAGELLEGLSMLIAGGPMGAEDLRDALAGMGYLPADLDVGAELTEKLMCGILNPIGVNIATDTPDHVMTRGELADLLMGFYTE